MADNGQLVKDWRIVILKLCCIPEKNIAAASLQRPLWFVSKVAVVERFDCIHYKKLKLGEF